MKTFILLASLLVGFSASAFNSELRGICKQQNTSDKCTIINKSRATVTQVSWLLAGSHVDYVEDLLVIIKPGQSVVVSNKPGRDNCLFTEDTSVTVYTKSSYKDFHQELQFNSKGQCSLVIK